MSDVVKALAAALPELGNAHKDARSHHGSFLSFPALLNHVRPVLAKHGLAVLQTIEADHVCTLFVHESGDVFTAGRYPIVHDPNPQKQGSAISYAKRYALAAACGVAGEDDDDGNAAQTATQPRQRQAGERREGGATQKQIGLMQSLMNQMGLADRDARLAYVAKAIGKEVTSSKELGTREVSAVIDRLKEDIDAASETA